jgi:hypothetical protein
MKFCASYQVQWWQTVFVSEIANFLQLQTIMRHALEETTHLKQPN